MTPYSRFDANSLILRDELAIDRTLLANERTLLAYLRSGVALVIAGVSIMQLASTAWFWWVGFCSIPVGVFATTFGVCRFVRMHKAISVVRKQASPRLQPPAAPPAAEE
jgi:putative membrane protein